ncbi:Trimethyllysine dioxygenase, mitochondrial [Caenorhabditis elegans]|uniref:Trimethyllysine dioxygenase, mitochondrial n=1 Tax=Caenorhabditis elegans TaxID=6239 RepID=Q21526_CAEEL|nr:Trimethyllysine dioxygenase, mitochondrial [Caenorhabditis elegans]CAA91416.2 Trimethyllysine dioxygenase, mitochondrial [Caenorhabditis elegans]|eukprot:NP_495793.2 Gamma Butyrobetaine Hydroxylase [Caenorhabditis elegans]
MIVQRRLVSGFTWVTGWNLKNIRSKNDCLEIRYENEGNPSKLIMPFVWLRDHCTSQKLYHLPTNQRKSNCCDITSLSKIKHSNQVIIDEATNSLQIVWIDGHQSKFKIGNIIREGKVEKNVSNDNKIYELWNSKSLKDVPRISKSTLSLQSFSKNLVKYGVIIVDGVEGTSEATEKLCQSLVPVHDTFFGQFWVFSNSATNDEPAYEDTAYGSDEIGPHTDGTYFDQTPGIQVFHCLTPAKTGGDTVLVDSFYCAEKLRNESPEDFEILCNTKISHHYLEGSPPGSSIHSVSLEKPVIERNSFGNITQIRFNPYDRAPFSCLNSSEASAAETIKFYEAYEKFSKICHNPDNSIEISLRPGSVIFIDNFRILHSRTSFQGYRQMCGCYLSRDNFMAKAIPFLSGKSQTSL